MDSGEIMPNMYYGKRTMIDYNDFMASYDLSMIYVGII